MTGRPIQSSNHRFRGWLSGLVLRLFSRKPMVTSSDLKAADFPTSTQRMGLRFTDKLRDAFRPRWLRKR
jgi:hypothetical protein